MSARAPYRRRPRTVASCGLLALLLASSGGAAQEGPPPSLPDALNRLELEPLTPDTAAAGLDLASRWLLEGEPAAAAELLQQTLELARELGDDATAAAARTRLGTVERLWLRPAAGTYRWTSARLVAAPGLELKRPSGIAARGDGELLVTDRALDLVLRFELRGGLVASWKVADPYQPSWSPSDEVTVAAKSKWLTLGDGPAPRESPRVQGRSPSGEELVDEARDAGDRRWLLDRRGGLYRRAADGSLDRLEAGPSVRRAAALAVDGLGNLYVLDEAEKQALVLDPAGRVLTRIGPRLPGGLELRQPEDLAVDEAGRLFFADRRLGIVALE